MAFTGNSIQVVSYNAVDTTPTRSKLVMRSVPAIKSVIAALCFSGPGAFTLCRDLCSMLA